MKKRRHGQARRLQQEYLVSVLRPLEYYSVPYRSQEPDVNGELAVREAICYFQVLAVAHGRSRPRLMHTVQSADDISMAAPLAFHIQPLDVHRPQDGPGRVDHDAPVVFRDDEATWLSGPGRPLTGLLFKTFRKSKTQKLRNSEI